MLRTITLRWYSFVVIYRKQAKKNWKISQKQEVEPGRAIIGSTLPFVRIHEEPMPVSPLKNISGLLISTFSLKLKLSQNLPPPPSLIGESEMIYADFAATTPTSASVKTKIKELLDHDIFGNPSSSHECMFAVALPFDSQLISCSWRVGMQSHGWGTRESGCPHQLPGVRGGVHELCFRYVKQYISWQPCACCDNNWRSSLFCI